MSELGLYPLAQSPLATSPSTPPRTRRTMTPNAPRKAESRRSLFSEPDLHHQLKECGVNVNRQILARAEDGSVTSPYLKVESSDGNEMLVLLDVPGNIPLDNNEEPMILHEGPTDHTVKPLLNNDVVGVSFVCQDNVCVKLGDYTHNLATAVPFEHTDEELIQSFPVVKLSTLKENPSRVSYSAKNASFRLREQSMVKAQAELAALGSNLASLDHEYKVFLAKQKHASDQLVKSINQLEKIKAQYDNMQEVHALSPDNQQKYAMVLQALKARTKLLGQISTLDQKIANVNNAVAHGADKLKILNAFLDAEFKDLSKV